MAIAIGAILLLAAGFMSNAGLERALLGESSGALTWGPSLFRALLAFHGTALIAFSVNRSRTRAASRAHHFADDQPVDRASDTPRWAWGALVALTVVALGLRLWKLNSCLWYDEVDTLVHLVREPLPKIVTMFSSQNQHMFFSVLARISVIVFGESAAAVRAPSVVFGVASVWALFMLGRRTVGVRVALLACGLFTFSYHHVWFSQNARGYMGLLFFTLVTTWLWHESRARRRVAWWMAYAVALALGTWIHMTMIFVAAAHAIVLGVAEIARPSNGDASRSLVNRLCLPVVAWVISGSLTLQLYALSLPEFLGSALHEVSRPSEWSNPLWVVLETLRSLASTGWMGVAAVGVGGGVTLLGLIRLFQRDRSVAVVFVLPGLVAGGTMLALGHFLWPRFFFFCMGFAVLLVIEGVVGVVELVGRGWLKDSRRRQLGTASALLMIAASALTLPRNYAFPKQDFIAARDYVEEERIGDDGVVGVGLAGVAYEVLYAPNWDVAQTVEELAGALDRPGRLWLVYTLPIEVKGYHPGMWELIQERFDRVKVFPGTLGAGAMIVCRSRSTPDSRGE